MPTASETVDETDEEAAPRPSLVLRLKRLLSAPFLLLGRLRRSRAELEETEAEEARPDRRDARREETEAETEAQAVPPLWRRLLPYGLLLLAGASAGGGGIYWLSAQEIARQSTALDERQDEIARLKGVLAGYDKMVLQNHKKLEAEQGKRAEIENRLSMAQADLTRRPAPREAPAASSAPGQRNPTEAGKTGDCTLRPGSVGSTLKSCLEEFNRP